MSNGIIDAFEIIEKLGQGGSAIVWKARQISLDRTVAVKVLLPKHTENEIEIDAFIKEARATAKLKHHGIIQVFDVAQAGRCFLHRHGSTSKEPPSSA